MPVIDHYPPFSGDDPVCPKCRKIGASTSYKEFGECIHGLLNEVMGYAKNERLHRECFRCGYSWDEATAPPEPREVHPYPEIKMKEPES